MSPPRALLSTIPRAPCPPPLPPTPSNPPFSFLKMAEEKQDMGEKLTAPADFAGPSSNRGCTDILCLLLIVAHWVAMTGKP